MLRAAAGMYLTGAKTVFFRERDEDPYHLEVVTRDEENPDPAKVLAALLRAENRLGSCSNTGRSPAGTTRS